MVWRIRSFWVASAAIAYVAFAALRASDGRGLAWLALVGCPIGLALAWRATAPPARGEDRVEPAARSAARACAMGVAMMVAARSGPGGPGFQAIASAGAAIAGMAALVALARIAPLGGLLEAPAGTRRLDAAAFASLLWTVAVALPAFRALSPSRTALLDPVAVDYATVAASIGSLGISIVAAARLRSLRRLELGIADRASAALWILVTSLAIGLSSSLVGVLPPERLMPWASTAAAVGLCWSAAAREPTAVARALRTLVTLAGVATPVALFAVWVTHAAPGRAGPAVFVACAITALAGLLTPLLARRLAPAGHRWLTAFDAATRAAMNPDPDVALESALVALRDTTGRVMTARGEVARGAPALYRLSPAEVVTADRAGYVHTEKADAPARLVELADLEPERILRAEVLRAALVRRPDVRPIAAWLEERSIAVAAVVRDDMGAIGVLTIPRGGRTSTMTLEEVRALRDLADRLGAVIGVSSSLARARDRELEARRELDRLRAEAQKLGDALARDASRLEAMARVIERPARVASYSPAARAAVEHLERLAQVVRPITLLTVPGVDAAAWAALAHLASPRRGGVLAFADGTSSAEHDLLRWRDAVESPLHVAAGGTLVLLDAQALPREVQSYIGAALPEDLGVIVTVPSTVDSLVAAGRMDERLADRLGDRAVALPTLAARGEDLRALALEHVAKIGVRVRGGPLGLDLGALALLGEHSWPGNDAELGAVLLRAALVCEGERIGAEDLRAVGFAPVGRISERPRAGAGGGGAGPIPIVKGKRGRR